MALFNEILQGRQQNLLTKMFAMVGGSPAPQLAPEIAPSFELTNYEHDGAVLQGVRWCMSGQYVAAGGAGNYSRVGIRNGAGLNPIPGSLVVVKRIWFGSATGPSIFYLSRIAPRADPVSTQRKHQDFRVNVNDPAAICPHDITYDNTTAVGPGANDILGAWYGNAGEMQVVECNIVLAPTRGGAYVEIINAGTNSTLVVTWQYYYRELAPGELYL